MNLYYIVCVHGQRFFWVADSYDDLQTKFPCEVVYTEQISKKQSEWLNSYYRMN